eukprot:TRINITY_DN4335_c0_g1_i1.p1 TRINITY_DN4335_c0_g1~~TRINITY_DN4335_c0_g1_i1.p1  ORF type:complete len:462 (+),score=92.11 TRINITY_DN4335_c0_g1_i1:93-1478(+)
MEFCFCGRHNLLKPDVNLFDIPERNLEPLVNHMFSKVNMAEILNCSEKAIAVFISKVRAQYTSTLYHNFRHCVDVVRFIFFVVKVGNVNKHFTQQEVVALLLAGLCHDIGHKGLNNNFLINNNDEMVKKFGKGSVLEKMHVRKTFEILDELVDTPFDIFVNLTEEETTHIRSFIETSILATDMAFHSKILGDFTKAQSKGIYKSEKPEDLSREHSDLLASMIIKSADISNVTRKCGIIWTDVLTKEFIAQGIQEEKLNLPVSPGCDVNQSLIEQAKSSAGFIKNCARPMFISLNKVYPEVYHPFIKMMSTNINIYNCFSTEEGIQRLMNDVEKSDSPIKQPYVSARHLADLQCDKHLPKDMVTLASILIRSPAVAEGYEQVLLDRQRSASAPVSTLSSPSPSANSTPYSQDDNCNGKRKKRRSKRKRAMYGVEELDELSLKRKRPLRALFATKELRSGKCW